MSDDARELTYRQYLELERLLELQRPRSSPEEHDEMLFIVIHQTYELWFRETLHELEKVKADFSAGRLFPALATLKRIRMILKTLVMQLDVLETMTPMSFAAFRDRLDTASGFQSVQFRELEFALGYKRAEVLRFFARDPQALDVLERRLSERSLADHFYDLLEARGVTIPGELRAKPVEEPTRPHDEIRDAVLRLYAEQPEMGLLFEALMDIDEGLQEWRYRHVKIVERTIGSKRGTGGSPGVEFLKRSLFRPVFPDLWAARHEL